MQILTSNYVIYKRIYITLKMDVQDVFTKIRHMLRRIVQISIRQYLGWDGGRGGKGEVGKDRVILRIAALFFRPALPQSRARPSSETHNPTADNLYSPMGVCKKSRDFQHLFSSADNTYYVTFRFLTGKAIRLAKSLSTMRGTLLLDGTIYPRAVSIREAACQVFSRTPLNRAEMALPEAFA